ncbi:hypothetical protein ACN6K9_004080 [Streptomyces sp. SAS_267]
MAGAPGHRFPTGLRGAELSGIDMVLIDAQLVSDSGPEPTN